MIVTRFHTHTKQQAKARTITDGKPNCGIPHIEESTFVTEGHCWELQLLLYNKEVQDSNIGSQFNSSERFPSTSPAVLRKRCDTAFKYVVYDTLKLTVILPPDNDAVYISKAQHIQTISLKTSQPSTADQTTNDILVNSLQLNIVTLAGLWHIFLNVL